MRGCQRNAIGLCVLSGCLALFFGCSEPATEVSHEDHEATMSSSPVTEHQVAVPTQFVPGETLFDTHCARCHGAQGSGTKQGPPLVHKIYEPSHHADFAFQRAAAQGVRAHHWKFGDMPKIDAVTPEDVSLIIQYIRWLQQQAGIF